MLLPFLLTPCSTCGGRVTTRARLALAVALLLASFGAAAQEQQNSDDSGEIDAARQLLQQGGAIPPEARQYLEAHPELKEQLIQGAKKKSQEEGKDQRAGGQRATGSRGVATQPSSPAPYDWRSSNYLKSLFGSRISPAESATLVHFGHELFDPREGGAAVLEDMPISPSYVVGPGDQIVVKTWGRLEGTNRVTVDRDGRIFYPKLGAIYVAGKTFGEVKELLQSEIGKMAEVHSEVTLGELKASRVAVVGEVRSPGWYNVSSLHTALQALYLAGGLKDIGSLRRIELRRGGKIASKIDLYDLLLRGDSHADLRLLQGDTIFVPVVARTIAVVGGVRRPAIYELTKESTLASAVELAGGFAPEAFTRRVQVERLQDHQARVVLDLDAAELDKAPRSFALADGDVLRVLAIVEDDEHVVTLEGNVHRPGRYQLKPGLTVGALLVDENAFLPETWFDYALLTRLVAPDLHPQLIALNLREIVLEKKPGADVALQGRDTLRVYPRSAFKDPRRATISGEVRGVAEPELALPEKVQASAAKREAIQSTGQKGREPGQQLLLRQDVRPQEGRKQPAARADQSGTDAAKFEALKGEAMQAQSLPEGPAKQEALRAIAEKANADKGSADKATQAGPTAEEERARDEAPHRGSARDTALTFDIAEGARVSDLITLAGGLTRDALYARGELVRVDAARNQQTLYFDVAKALTGDAKENLELQDEDRVRIHSVWETRPRRTVSAMGEVRDPGEYLLTEGMKLSDLVFKAGGLKEDAYGAAGEIARYEVLPDGSLRRTQTVTVQPTLALEGNADADLALQPFDQLVVHQIPDWGGRIKVTLGGEVRFPGVYAVHKGEKLSAVIARAGGFTDDAYLHAAQFARESSRLTQQAAIDRLVEELQVAIAEKAQEAPAGLGPEDVQYERELVATRKSLLTQLKLAKATGRVIVRLPDDGKLAGTPADLLLENNDRLEIPKKTNVVNVVGRVYNPTGLLFEPDHADSGYYLDRVGGPTESADEDHIFILRADGTVAVGGGLFSSVKSVRLQPGDSVVVPNKLTQSRLMRDFRDITQIMMQIAVTAAVVLRF